MQVLNLEEKNTERMVLESGRIDHSESDRKRL